MNEKICMHCPPNDGTPSSKGPTVTRGSLGGLRHIRMAIEGEEPICEAIS